MNPEAHSKCQDGVACTGGGCRINTGKTARKQNWNRPKMNKHEGSHVSASAPVKKGR